MADDEKIQQAGVEAAKALRAAAEVLTDAAIPFERRLQAFRRCISRHAMLSARFMQLGNRYIIATSLARQSADSNPPAEREFCNFQSPRESREWTRIRRAEG